MNDSEVLIIGAHGQLGKALQLHLPKARVVDRDQLDITDLQALEQFDWSGLRVIINAAAYTNVDGAQSGDGRAAAWSINAQAVAYLAGLASRRDLILVHVSSETVFDGTIAPHDEGEAVTPLGVYAQSKAAGDIAASTTPKHYVVRTSWLIGDGPNFVRAMIGLATKNISPTVVNDQTGRLTFATTLAAGIRHLLATKADYGTYNLSDGGQVASWAEITRSIFDELGRSDLTVTGVTTSDYFKDKPTAAPRPLKGEFSLEKIHATGFKLPDWRDELKQYIKSESKEETK